MKPGSSLVNIARGKGVDTEALVAVLCQMSIGTERVEPAFLRRVLNRGLGVVDHQPPSQRDDHQRTEAGCPAIARYAGRAETDGRARGERAS